MKLWRMVVVSLGLIMIVGCAGPYSGGMLFSNYSVLMCSPDDSQGLTPGSKTGEASMVNFLGLVAAGDASITAAAQNGGITNIKTADFKYNSILGIINTTTTIVTGE